MRDWLPPAAVVAAGFAYPGAVVYLRGRDRPWPPLRHGWWWAGVLAAAAALTVRGEGFTAHLTEHLLLGMAAPLGVVLAAPGTLVFCLLRPVGRRRLATLLATRPVGVLTHPLTVSALATATVAVLYRTPLLEL